MHADTVSIPVESTAGPTPKSAAKVRLLTLDALDQRTSAARRAHDLIAGIEADLGGADRLSEGSRQLVQRAAVLGAYIENCEAQWLGGAAVDLAGYLAAINAQRRVLATIGLERRTRDVSIPLRERWRLELAEADDDEAVDAAGAVDAQAGAPTAAAGTLASEPGKAAEGHAVDGDTSDAADD